MIYVPLTNSNCSSGDCPKALPPKATTILDIGRSPFNYSPKVATITL